VTGKQLQNEVERVMREIDSAGEPSKMTRAQWIEFLEQLATDVECRLDCAREEQANEDKDNS
jgi:hypothetical protein